ncbi:hypothetical protein BJ508DRAFT_333293 [Ascobolus immersus RN42]|uniref:Uncharacterized protein n=1 Tax=Ascobolus immersus RN42 TaxID=1160509 RepID=A0A3N4HJX9_ASCIM|nr:hypothetical protein BJ508DRAFT_333293 [Ascobolus immersus RN42]
MPSESHHFFSRNYSDPSMKHLAVEAGQSTTDLELQEARDVSNPYCATTETTSTAVNLVSSFTKHLIHPQLALQASIPADAVATCSCSSHPDQPNPSPTLGRHCRIGLHNQHCIPSTVTIVKRSVCPLCQRTISVAKSPVTKELESLVFCCRHCGTKMCFMCRTVAVREGGHAVDMAPMGDGMRESLGGGGKADRFWHLGGDEELEGRRDYSRFGA